MCAVPERVKLCSSNASGKRARVTWLQLRGGQAAECQQDHTCLRSAYLSTADPETRTRDVTRILRVSVLTRRWWNWCWRTGQWVTPTKTLHQTLRSQRHDNHRFRRLRGNLPSSRKLADSGQVSHVCDDFSEWGEAH
jgi:hypothetical protein